MCDMSHDLAEKLGEHSRRLIECSHETRAKVRSALQATRRTADSRPGHLRQRKPQPLAPRPCACPVRTSAPSRHRATSAPAYHSSYLRNYHSFKVAAAVLLSVNRVGQRTTEHRAAPRQTISKRSNVAGVTEGEGLEKVATPRLGWEKNPLRI